MFLLAKQNTINWMTLTMIYFLIVLDAGSLRSLCQYSWVLVKTLPGFRMATSLCPHMREKERVSSVSPYKDMNLIMRTGHGRTEWFQIGKEVCQGCILSPAYLTYMQSTSCEMLTG